MGKGQKIVAVLSGIIIISYIIYAIYLLIVHSTDTYIITQGTISQEDDGVGYIIRDEQVKKIDDYKNGIYTIASEGQRVAINEPIFRYYSDTEKQITDQITEINYKIQDLLEKDKSVTSADIKAIENQIENKVEDINTLNNYQEISEYKKNIDTLISKKINFIGDVTENKEVKNLIKERKTLESKLKNGSEYQRAPKSGIVSYRVDGLEDVLKPDDFNSLDKNFLENLNLKTGQTVTSSEDMGKIINNYQCYIIFNSDTDEAKSAQVGTIIKVRLQNSDIIKAEIENIIDEQDGSRTITIKMTNDVEKLI